MIGVEALSYDWGRREPVSLRRSTTGMAQAAAGSIVRQIESLFEGGSMAGLTDRQLWRGSSPAAMPLGRPRSRRWWPGTGRWF